MTGNERERRFGIEDPKFWVKRVIDESGERKLIKLTYFESFITTLGGVKIRCFRDPDKEGDILVRTKDHPHFMHGNPYRDEKGNNIRVLDVIRGPNFFVFLDSFRKLGHEPYFRTELPVILRKLVKAFEAIHFLHMNGFRHGDIRNDHIMVERATGNYVWIDFDYDYDAGENPFSLDIFGLGNILLCAIGKGIHNLHNIYEDTARYGDLMARLEPEDLSILDKWRLVNLRKFYPYIPKMLNDILMHFSKGAEVYYESVDEIIEDMNRCLHSVF